MERRSLLEISIMKYSLTGIMEKGAGLSFLYPFLDDRLDADSINMLCVLTSHMSLTGEDAIIPSIPTICSLMRTRKQDMLLSRTKLKESGYINYELIENPLSKKHSFMLNEYAVRLEPDNYVPAGSFRDEYHLFCDEDRLPRNNYYNLMDYGYGILPKKVVEDSSLVSNAKLLFYLFCAKMGTSQSCWISQEFIFHLLRVDKEGGIKKRRIKTYLDQLKNSGYMSFVSESMVCGDKKVKGYTGTLIANKDASKGKGKVYVKSVDGSMAPVIPYKSIVCEENVVLGTAQKNVDNSKINLSTPKEENPEPKRPLNPYKSSVCEENVVLGTAQKSKDKTTENAPENNQNVVTGTAHQGTAHEGTATNIDDNISPYYLYMDEQPKYPHLTRKEHIRRAFFNEENLLEKWGIEKAFSYSKLLIRDQDEKEEWESLIAELSLSAYILRKKLPEIFGGEGKEGKDLKDVKDLVIKIADRIREQRSKGEKINKRQRYIMMCFLKELYSDEKAAEYLKEIS